MEGARTHHGQEMKENAAEALAGGGFEIFMHAASAPWNNKNPFSSNNGRPHAE